MKKSTGILLGASALAVAMLATNPGPSPTTGDLDQQAASPSAAPQDDATDGAQTTDQSTDKSLSTAASAHHQPDTESALAEALKAMAAATEDSPNTDAALERTLEQLKQARHAAALAHHQPDAESTLAEALKALAIAKEDSPNTDAALERALEQLKQARHALAQYDSSWLHTSAYCESVEDCFGQDACIIVQLPPIEYGQANYTARGTYAFATIFSAAAARGVENATIRAMNATRVCPTCKVTHAAKTPCVKVSAGGQAPPPQPTD